MRSWNDTWPRATWSASPRRGLERRLAVAGFLVGTVAGALLGVFVLPARRDLRPPQAPHPAVQARADTPRPAYRPAAGRVVAAGGQ
jgi:hypothetical protein